MNRNFLCSLGLLLAIAGCGSQLLAGAARTKKVKKPSVMPAVKIIGAANRQAMKDKRRAEIKAQMKRQGKAGSAKKAFQKKARAKRVRRHMRPRAHRRQFEARSIAQELTAPRYGRFIPDPDFGKPHRVSLKAAEANRSKKAALKKPGAHKGMS